MSFNAKASTDLIRATRLFSLADVRIALEAGADPNTSLDGWTPIDSMLYGGSPDTRAITLLLLEFGAFPITNDEYIPDQLAELETTWCDPAYAAEIRAICDALLPPPKPAKPEK